VVIGMCDGSCRFIADSVSGTVWAGLLSPEGMRLPANDRQMPLAENQIPGNQ
jgi:hypothetical protein